MDAIACHALDQVNPIIAVLLQNFATFPHMIAIFDVICTSCQIPVRVTMR